MSFFDVLTKHTTMTVILPDRPNKDKAGLEKRFPTLYLLHGFSDHHSMWTDKRQLNVMQMNVA